MTDRQIKHLKSAEFKRLCGVQPETFQAMVVVLQPALERTGKRGGQAKLATEEQQLVVEQCTCRILSTVCGRGRLHDLRWFKNSRTRFAPWTKCLADKGYRGPTARCRSKNADAQPGVG
ncbi:hypothetical protein [Gloeobacter morelensis]|uniref:Transposase n=1 Tax=Gloeobacter morelensis MG652769 TaxID=2781736 RepID=A0ABY3PRB4_9CYAN|nr:hypothetical protein [Gloeobacter morelensis]UFP96154.1 hypothetical protein ISF26_08090 [Gloeobacter morelensis MG652769]